jgi:hypothetical protein
LFGSLARRIAQRLVDIEADEQDPAGDTVAGLVQFGVEVYFNGREHTPRLRWSPSTVPDGASLVDQVLFGLLPYYATGRIPEGGAELGYLPTYYFGNGWGVSLPLAPLSWVRSRGLEDRLAFRSGVNFLRSFPGLLGRVELGPYLSYAYRAPTDPSARGTELFGVELAAQPLYNRLRWSLGVDSDLNGALRVSSQLGIADLNGLLYWLRRAVEP